MWNGDPVGAPVIGLPLVVVGPTWVTWKLLRFRVGNFCLSNVLFLTIVIFFWTLMFRFLGLSGLSFREGLDRVGQ